MKPTNLFRPIRIGSLRTKNRLLMPAMSINFGVDQNGFVTDQLTAYFAARAKGGVGMMLVGGGCVHPTGLELPDLPRLWDDGCIPALAKMVNTIKPLGVLFGMQLMHGGRQAYHDQKVAPSAIAAPALVKSAPRALTIAEIEEMIAAFGDAALRCKQAGFDLVEIHGAHGYLINQFLAPNANLRSDDYGGSFANRTRFFLKVIDDIKHKCGIDYPVGARINGEDYIDGGWSLQDTTRLVPMLEQAGLDYLHVSAGVYGSRQLTIPSMYVPQGCFAHLAGPLLRQTQVNEKAGYNFANAIRYFLRHDPDVILVGEIRDAETATTAVTASTTGHLVLSTLHANSALGAIPRLRDLGIRPFLIADSLIGVVSQRLVRKVCSSCKTAYKPFDWEKKYLKNGDIAELYRGKGCDICNHTGYFGRTLVYELLSVDRELALMIEQGADVHQLTAKSKESGYVDIFDITSKKVLAGITTTEEAVRTLGSIRQS